MKKKTKNLVILLAALVVVVGLIVAVSVIPKKDSDSDIEFGEFKSTKSIQLNEINADDVVRRVM